MKKTLLTLVCAALAAAPVSAQVYEYYDGALYSKLSLNGKWLAQNEYTTLGVLDRSTGQTYFYSDPDAIVTYTLGMGNSVTDDGLLVGCAGSDAAIWQDGEFHPLPQPTGQGSQLNMAHAITRDGSRIAGFLGTTGSSLGSDGLSVYPVVWTKTATGEWECQALPYPEKDFSGQAPQYVTAVDISDDGKTVIGQVRDFSGYYNYPIIYKEGADGQWTYQLVGTDKVWDAEKVKNLPEAPVEPKYVNIENYMTADELAAYQEALTEYNELLALYYQGLLDEAPVPPVQSSYISDEARLQQYDDDLAAYQEASNAYWVAYDEFMAELDKVVTGNTYSFNNLAFSRNGRYYVALFTIKDGWDQTQCPITFDLNEAQPQPAMGTEGDMVVSAVLDDGTTFLASPAFAYTRSTTVVQPGAEEAVSFSDYLAARDEKAAQWMTEEYGDAATGTIVCNPEANIFLSYKYRDEGEMMFVPMSCLLDLNKGAVTAIDGVAAAGRSAFSVRYADGRLSFSPGVQSAAVYDVAGRRVAVADASGRLSAVPATGTYVVYMQGADGTAAAQKLQLP